MENIISLNHQDINKAIEAYISAHGVTLTGKAIEIKLASGRGANALNSASVTVTNKEEVSTETVAEDAVKSPETAKEPEEKQEDTSTEEKTEEVIEDDDEIDLTETKETLVVEDEVKSDTSEPGDDESLFST